MRLSWRKRAMLAGARAVDRSEIIDQDSLEGLIEIPLQYQAAAVPAWEVHNDRFGGEANVPMLQAHVSIF